jgi:hypothetical protein
MLFSVASARFRTLDILHMAQPGRQGDENGIIIMIEREISKVSSSQSSAGREASA